ncbi:MAG: hypothetical protein ACOYD7_07190 [Raoultibacter sp.]|jgi:hypothetical protein
MSISHNIDEFPEEFFDEPEEKKPQIPAEPLTYVAHYTSPITESPTKGFFEFDSIYRASSKQNIQDARIRMLEIYGKEAVSWVIDEVKLKKKTDKVLSEQLELDFREPKKQRKRRVSKKYL